MTICHCMRGRLRVKTLFIQASRERASALEQWLSQQPHVQQVKTFPLSGDVILYYNPDKTTADTIWGHLQKALRFYRNILKTNKTLLIEHSMRGRLRIQSEFIRASKERASALKQWLSQQPQIKSVETYPASGCILLSYYPEKATADTLLSLIRKGIDALYFSTESLHLLRAGKLAQPERSFTRHLIELGALTVFAGYAAIRRFLLNAPLAEGTFSMVSLVSVVGAIPLFQHALEDLREGRGMGLYPFLASACLLAIIMGQTMAALEIIWVLRVGMLLEDYIAERSRRAVSKTFQITEKNACVVVDDMEVRVEVGKVLAGDTVVVRTGEKIPVDGKIIRGEALVDEAYITGRAEPELRCVGDRVFAGTILQQGILYVWAEQVGNETYLARTLHLVEHALAQRAPVKKQADILANRLSQLGLWITLGTLVFTGDLLRAVTVMIIMSCPCATVLAVSTALSAALANAARNKSLIKGGLYLEMLENADYYCFDKTGTITETTPQVIAVIPRTPSQTEARILSLAADAEFHNNHPIAQALMKAAAGHGISPNPCTESEIILGRGIKAVANGDTILVGNALFMEEEGVNIAYYQKKSLKFGETGHTVIYVVRNHKLQGMIALTNPVRPNAKAVIDWLRKDGISDVYLFTGDTNSAAREIAINLGFTDYFAEVMPETKAVYVEEFERTGKQVVMVGDGINDALALSRASAGIAMGAGGSEAAIEAADIALVDNNLERLVTQRQLSHKTFGIIHQNYHFAVSTTILGILLGVAGWLSPIMAGSIHIVHTLGIMTNSSRLLNWKAPGLGESSRVAREQGSKGARSKEQSSR